MKRYILLLGFACCFSVLFAQSQKVKNQPYADQKIFHYGFMMGVHSQDLEFFHTGITTPKGETWFAEIPNHNPGFNVGLIGDLYLTPVLNLRFSPSLYFGDKNIVFREYNSGKETNMTMKTNYLMLPIHLKFSSERLNNIRPYLIAGPSIAFDLSKKKGSELLAKSFATYFEIGVGCNFYYRYFKFCPELKFCLGLNDLLEKNRSDLVIIDDIKYTNALSKMTSRLFVLSLNFE